MMEPSTLTFFMLPLRSFKVALKHLMEAVVPILTALKHVLERAQSPLLRELMFYFGELFRYATLHSKYFRTLSYALLLAPLLQRLTLFLSFVFFRCVFIVPRGYNDVFMDRTRSRVF